MMMKMSITNTLLEKDFIVQGKFKERKVKCGYCGKWCNISVVPHVRMEHPDIWKSWQRSFVELRNQGLTPRQIMMKYNMLFSWTIIEKEIQMLMEQNPSLIKVNPVKEIKEWRPRNFRLERTSVWRFPKRGDWAVHTSEYRGNWAPQVPRNLILTYSKRGDTILDPFVGGGTTLIECYLEGRNGIGVDINPVAVAIAKQRIVDLENAARLNSDFKLPKVKINIIHGDARELGFIETESIDLVCAHPPYANAMKYTQNQKKDLSHIDSIEMFCKEMGKVAKELFRVLKKKKKCGVLIGDIRKNGTFIPLEYKVMSEFVNVGFTLSERIIKEQFNDKSTTFFPKLNHGRHLIAHEYLLIFEK